MRKWATPLLLNRCSPSIESSPTARSTILTLRGGCRPRTSHGLPSSTATAESGCTILPRPSNCNEADSRGAFVHPVVRAVLLHFGLAYDHPFEDGNGRTARILFFWSMRKSGYWLAEYLSISTILRKAPARYGRAFLETETDEGDTTYFLIHQLEVIERAIEEMRDYLRRKTREIQEIEALLKGAEGFNRRQLELLTNAVRHPDSAYSFGGHATAQRITHETARADLSDLARRGLLVQRRMGREYLFEPAPDLPGLLKEST
jgi:Fic family protein